MDTAVTTQEQETASIANQRRQSKGLVFDVQRYCVNDGPGIRTTVFLKGCYLHCSWCSNPESQRFRPEMLYQRGVCTRCYRCVQVCPHHATSIAGDGSLEIARGLCQACGECVSVCYSEARHISGRYMTLDEVMEVARKDMVFYHTSGGGVTLSGGEPTIQPDFAVAILQSCREERINTVIETCGYAEKATFSLLANNTDLVLFDVKHLDLQSHRRLTGGDNSLILANLKWLAEERKAVIVRLPLIPSLNDTAENLLGIGQFLAGLGLKQVELTPYHEFGLGKYEALGQSYSLGHIRPPRSEAVEAARGILLEYGLEVGIA